MIDRHTKRSMHQQLREIGELLGLDCGDNSCLCAPRKGGMRTNGGCRCDVSGAVLDLIDLRDRLQGERDRLQDKCDDLIGELADVWQRIE